MLWFRAGAEQRAQKRRIPDYRLQNPISLIRTQEHCATLLSETRGASKKYFIDNMQCFRIPAAQTQSAQEFRLLLEHCWKSNLRIKPLVSATASSDSSEPVPLDGFVVPTNNQVVLCPSNCRCLSTPSHHYVICVQGESALPSSNTEAAPREQKSQFSVGLSWNLV